MHRMNLMILCCIFIMSATPFAACADWLSGSQKVLLTIDDKEYTTEDFKSWWKNWQEPGMSFPENPDEYVDFLLQYREADRMKLYEDPGFQQKVMTFLKARTLLMLKYDEIDSKINLPDEELWEIYEKNYVPAYQLNIISFNSREEAEEFLRKVGGGPISDEKLAELEADEKNPLNVHSGLYRKESVNEGWYDILDSLEPQGLSQIVDASHGVMILRLQGLQEGDKDDFETVRDRIAQDLRKRKSAELTFDLINRLREKYHVKINEERLKEMDIDAPLENFTDAPLVTTDRGVVTEKEFMRQVIRTRQVRHNSGFTDDSVFQYKASIMNGIISQTLTTWEGMSRGYETKPPFKDVFDFYRQYRMIKVLQRKMLANQPQITEDEIKAYYNDHINEYTKPEIVRIIQAQGSEDDLKNLWTKVIMGEDFREAAKEKLGNVPQSQDIPINHLSPETKTVVKKLTKGELSKVFMDNGQAILVKLVEHYPAKPIPLEQVKQMIGKQLYKERNERVKKEYLEKLRASAKITIEEKVWENLKKEMEQEDANQQQ